MRHRGDVVTIKCCTCGVVVTYSSKGGPERIKCDKCRRHNDLERAKLYQRQMQLDPLQKQKCKERHDRYRATHREFVRQIHREWHLKSTYGLTINGFEAMCQRQHHRCAICGRLRTLVVDHNHKTGRARQLLCHACNHGLGSFRDSSTLCMKAAQYLAKHDEPLFSKSHA
jgi:hypothetical protein